MLRLINKNKLRMSILFRTFAKDKKIRRGTAATEHKKIMKFKQIREIKTKNEGLELNTHQTHMFNNEQWASLWKIKFMTEQDMKDLFKYLNDNHLNYFICMSGIHIQ